MTRLTCPTSKGLYCIYRSKHLLHVLPYQVDLRYIGQSEDIKERLSDHDREKACRKELAKGEDLYFTWALIHHFRPHHNKDFRNHFFFPGTHVTITDPMGTLTGQFVVKCTEEALELL